MLQCTLQANGLGLLGFRLASLASFLILDQAGTPVDVNGTLLYGVHCCSKHFEHILDVQTPPERPGGHITVTNITP